MKLSKFIFVEEYIKYTIEALKAMEKGDSRTNNRYVKKLYALEKKYENEDYFIETLKELMDNDNLRVASGAASESLRRNSNIEKAVSTLKKVSEKASGITAFTAEMVLKVWNERGSEGLMGKK